MAHAVRLVGWLKHVKIFFFFSLLAEATANTDLWPSFLGMSLCTIEAAYDLPICKSTANLPVLLELSLIQIVSLSQRNACFDCKLKLFVQVVDQGGAACIVLDHSSFAVQTKTGVHAVLDQGNVMAKPFCKPV